LYSPLTHSLSPPSPFHFHDNHQVKHYEMEYPSFTKF